MSTPKERFLTSGHAGDFAKLVASEHFEPACDYALLQLRLELPANCSPNLPTDPLTGFDANAQTVGAMRVLEILKHLHEPVKAPTTLTTPKLHY